MSYMPQGMTDHSAIREEVRKLCARFRCARRS